MTAVPHGEVSWCGSASSTFVFWLRSSWSLYVSHCFSVLGALLGCLRSPRFLDFSGTKFQCFVTNLNFFDLFHVINIYQPCQKVKSSRVKEVRCFFAKKTPTEISTKRSRLHGLHKVKMCALEICLSSEVPCSFLLSNCSVTVSPDLAAGDQRSCSCPGMTCEGHSVHAVRHLVTPWNVHCVHSCNIRGRWYRESHKRELQKAFRRLLWFPKTSKQQE